MRFYNSLLTVLCMLSSVFFTFPESLIAQGFNSISTSDGVNVVAVGNNGKMYRSANGGTTWVSTNFGSLNMNNVFALGSDIWIAANSGNVYKALMVPSTPVSYNTGSANNLYSVFFTDANTGYVCGDAGFVYKTINGGVNWSLSGTGITGGRLNSISFKDALNGIIVGNTGVIYSTSDGGSSWSSEPSGTNSNLLKVKHFGDSVFIAGENGTLLKNVSGSWVSLNVKNRTDIRSITGPDVSNVRICGGGGFIRNNKSGSNDFMNFEANPMLANLTDIFYYDNNKAWAVSSLNAVIIRTTNGGTNWSMPAGSTVSYNWVSKSGASGNFLGNNLWQHPSKNDVVFTAFSNKVYRSSNRGENWSQIGINIPTATNPHSLIISPIDTNIILVATEGSSGDRVYRSTNYGANWTSVLSLAFSNYGQPLEINQNNPNVYYFAPDGGGFYRSTNSGANWTEISGNFPFRSPCEILVTWDNPDVIIVGDGVTSSSERAKMFRSTNGGVNWTKIDSVTSSETPSMCNSAFDTNLIWCTEWGGSNVYKSTNMGAKFNLSHSTGFSGWGSDVCREDPTLVLTGSWGNAAVLSTNGGTNWVNVSTGLSGHGGGILAIERGYILAQQGSNLYKLNITYNNTVLYDSLDVQALSIGLSGSSYFTETTVAPAGTVKNNSGLTAATFNVTRSINPGGYVSTKSVVNLAPGTSTSVAFDPWTFVSGQAYTVRDSVYLTGDTKAANDVVTGSITPYYGESISLLSESFSKTFPPENWNFEYSGQNYWIASSLSAYGSGNGSAKYNFYNAVSSTGSQSLISELFTAPSSAGDSLQYDYAYAPYTDGSTDSIIIEVSNDGGSSYSTLQRLYGRNTATGDYALNTAPQTSSEFSPTSGQWMTKKWGLPVGTNKVRIRARSGYGNNFYLDNMIITSNRLFTEYHIRLIPEGQFNGTTLNMKDTVRAYLRNTTAPFAIVDSAAAVIDSVTYSAPFLFRNVTTGTYYIQLIHRNTVETWSKSGGEPVTQGVASYYDFTSAQSSAYGNNLVPVSSKYCIYSGDVDRNGSVNLNDILAVYNSTQVFASGYVVSDLNGDALVTLSDVIIVYNNSSKFASKVTPLTSPEAVTSVKDKNRSELMNYMRTHSEKEDVINTDR